MAEANLTGGLVIPGSAPRRKKAYSVSLHENNFDISEVPCSAQEEIPSLDGDRTQNDTNLTSEKCYSCGQILPPRIKIPVTNNSTDNQSNKDIPVARQPPRLDNTISHLFLTIAF